MVQNIFVVVMFVLVLAAGVWGWWIENRGSSNGEDRNNIAEYKECSDEE